MIFLNLFVFRLLARFISMSSSFLNFLCPMHTLLVSYLYLGSLFHTIEHKFCGLSTGLRFCVKATKFYYYYLYCIVLASFWDTFYFCIF